ncbi:glycosyltransferase family 2 protein [Paraferrimonas sedimenticola]|uniref:Glycosyl transferase family A n=1 Tax=Paraferrimonas sedimenticola TaxID=375674 RepID=A0AA37RV63_9GAMM|nr:glycosyltransferase family 2 protein [Paraferrimonas sedimenticola]GLP96021.1 glycosyl transferase family A [Paraferrimonas sedimenticola]
MSTLISLCLCTFKRNSVIDTLQSLSQLTLPKGVEVEIVVVDNCENGSGRERVNRFAETCRWPLTYHVEPRKNICHARNACIRYARGEWLTFVDDDEVAQSDWLAHLYETAITYEASVVMGAVKAHYPDSCPEWIVQGDYFNRAMPKRGTQIDVGATNNVLIRVSDLPAGDRSFDPSFGITGGGDTELFNRMYRLGKKIVTCPEAIVEEVVEDKRLTRQYLLRRSVRIGEVYGRIFFPQKWSLSGVYQLCKASLALAVATAAVPVLKLINEQRSFQYQMKQRASLGKVRYFFNVPQIEIYGKHKE